jgi:cyanophycin synthetase
MRSSAPSIYSGPSIYSPHPVLRYTLALASSATLPRTFDRDVVDSLFACLPGLRERRDSCDAPGVLERRLYGAEPTALNRLFEHLCIELENLTGVELHCVRANGGGGRIAVDDALVPYEDESVGIEAGRLAFELIDALAPAEPPLADSAPPPVDIQRRVDEFRQFAERQALPVQDRAIVGAARARDIPVTRIARRIVQLGYGRHQQRISGTQTTRLNGISSMLAANKDYSRRVLSAVGLPVVPYERVDRRRAAVAAAKSSGFPVVVKPNNANMGRGVSVGMKTVREVREAYARAREFDRSVIVEPFVAGADYRMLVIDGRLRAAAKRVPAHVVGDGVHTIEELVREANSDPRRGRGQRSSWTRLEFDEQSDRLLAELGYERHSVARKGELVFLRRNANTSSGGTAVDVTDQVHPQNREIAERAARMIGLDIAGVDVLVRDISLPMREQGGVICEINSRPGIRKHLWPAEGRPRDLTGPIIDMLFPPGTPSRIPIAVVTGIGSTLDTARLLAHVLSGGGSTVGLAARDGVSIGGRCVHGGGLDGASAARMLLLDPAVDVAVIELSPADVLRNGLGYDWCDACAVIDGDETGALGFADAIRVVVDATRQSVVLASDDEWCRTLESSADKRLCRIAGNVKPSATHERSALYAAALALCLGRPPEQVERDLRTYPGRQ